MARIPKDRVELVCDHKVGLVCDKVERKVDKVKSKEDEVEFRVVDPPLKTTNLSL